MKFYIQGDKSRALCEQCGLVGTTFLYRDIFLEQSRRTVKDVLVGVCDQCSCIVSTPAQSTPAIREEREKAVQSIEAQLPAPYVELLDLACQSIDPLATPNMRKRLLLFYIRKHTQHTWDSDLIQQAYDELQKIMPAEAGLPKKRISLKVSARMAEEFQDMTQRVHKNKTETLKLLVAEIKRDILDKKLDAAALKELDMLAFC